MPDTPPILTRDLGRLAYAEALDLQRELNQQVIDGLHPPTLLLVEHDPVITLTRRPSVRDHLIASDQQLVQMGIDTQQTDRGGDITYHGPGQLVVYPILKLSPLGLNLSSYMRLLEQAVIDTAATWGIQAHRECGATGVWVQSLEACGLRLEGECDKTPVTADPKPQASNPKPPTAKICAMGVRIRKNTTLHGLALNVSPNLAHFDTIIPCGLQGRPVTSMKQLLGDACPTLDAVKDELTQRMQYLLANARTIHCDNK